METRQTPQPLETEKDESFPWIGLSLLALGFILAQSFLGRFDFIDRYGLEKVRSVLLYFLSLQGKFQPLSPALSEYPPFPYWWTALFFQFGGGFSFFLCRLSLLSFALILIFSLYRIGAFYAGKTGGWLLTLLILGNFWTILWSRAFEHNFAEMAVVSLAFSLLLLSRSFTQKRYSLYLGAALGLCLLTRYAIIFLLPPLLWVILAQAHKSGWKTRGLILAGLGFLLLGWKLLSLFPPQIFKTFSVHYLFWQTVGPTAALAAWIWWRKKGGENPPWQKNLLYATSIALLAALPWYLGSLEVQAEKLQLQLFWQQSLGYLKPSLHFFLNCYSLIFPGFWILLIIGAGYCLINFRKPENQMLLVGFFGGTLLIGWLVPKEHSFRYILPMLPFAGLLAVSFLRGMPRWFKGIFLGAACLWLLFNFSATYRVWTDKTPLLRAWVSGQYQPLLLAETGQAPSPQEAWWLEKISRALRKAWKEFPDSGINLLELDQGTELKLNLNYLNLMLLKSNYLPWGAFTLIEALSPHKIEDPGLLSQTLSRYRGGADLLLVGFGRVGEVQPWEQRCREQGIELQRLTAFPLNPVYPQAELALLYRAQSQAPPYALPSREDVTEGLSSREFGIFRFSLKEGVVKNLAGLLLQNPAPYYQLALLRGREAPEVSPYPLILQLTALKPRENLSLGLKPVDELNAESLRGCNFLLLSGGRLPDFWYWEHALEQAGIEYRRLKIFSSPSLDHPRAKNQQLRLYRLNQPLNRLEPPSRKPPELHLSRELEAFYFQKVNYRQAAAIYLNRIPPRTLSELARILQRQTEPGRRIQLNFFNLTPEEASLPAGISGGNTGGNSPRELQEPDVQKEAGSEVFWLVGGKNPQEFERFLKMLNDRGYFKEVTEFPAGQNGGFRLRLYRLERNRS